MSELRHPVIREQFDHKVFNLLLHGLFNEYIGHRSVTCSHWACSEPMYGQMETFLASVVDHVNANVEISAKNDPEQEIVYNIFVTDLLLVVRIKRWGHILMLVVFDPVRYSWRGRMVVVRCQQ